MGFTNGIGVLGGQPGSPGVSIVGFGHDRIGASPVDIPPALQYSIVRIHGLLFPGIKNNLGKSSIGMIGAGHAAYRIIIQDGRKTNPGQFLFRFILPGSTEERFVLPDWFAFVIEDSTTIADPP